MSSIVLSGEESELFLNGCGLHCSRAARYIVIPADLQGQGKAPRHIRYQSELWDRLSCRNFKQDGPKLVEWFTCIRLWKVSVNHMLGRCLTSGSLGWGGGTLIHSVPVPMLSVASASAEFKPLMCIAVAESGGVTHISFWECSALWF